MVPAGQQPVGVVDPARASDPPVRRVKGVRVMRAAQHQPDVLEPGLELVLAVDADVPTGEVVVLAVQRPVDALREPRRHRHGHATAGLEHARQLGHRTAVVGDVLEHLGRDDPVEGPIGEGQCERIALHRQACPARRDLRLGLHGLDHVAHGLELAAVGIEGDDAGSTSEGGEGMPPAAAAHVEQGVARAESQAVEVNGEHAPPSPAAPRAPRARARPAPSRGPAT